MRKKLSIIMLVFFTFSILTPALAATENLIIRVGYPQAGNNQYVGTVRIYESEATIDSIQKGDVFTIFMENAEFNNPPSLMERGRFDLQVISGGQDGDTYITYQFVDPSSARTGRVIIDFILDDMRALGGDISARVDSPFSGVSSGYFSMGSNGDKEAEKDKITEERVLITDDQIKEAREKAVNILVNNEDYQLLLYSKEMPQEGSLQVDVIREDSKNTSYLTDIYSFEFTAEKGELIPRSGELRINLGDIKEKNNITANQLTKEGQKRLPSYYDSDSDYLYIKLFDLADKTTLTKGTTGLELVFKEGDFISKEAMKFAPVRKTADWYGWEVAWNPFTRMVNLEKEDQLLEIDEKDYLIHKDRSYISLNFLEENLSAISFELDEKLVFKK